MKVRIDGKIVEREHTICYQQSGYFGSPGGRMPREEPELLDGEEVMWGFGDPIPTIFKVNFHEREHDD